MKQQILIGLYITMLLASFSVSRADLAQYETEILEWMFEDSGSGDFTTDSTSASPTEQVTSSFATTTFFSAETTNDAVTKTTVSQTGSCTSSINLCDDPSSWCNDTENGFQCPCKPNYHFNSDGTCAAGLQFGGNLYVQPASRRKRSLEGAKQALFTIYKDSSGFVDVQVKSMRNYLINGEIYDYILLYKINSNADELFVSTHMASFFENESCSTGNTCQVESLNILIEESVKNAGNSSDVVCNDIDGYCDAISSKCTSRGGTTTCECRDGYVSLPGSERVCEAIICATNGDCNAPFGTCVANSDNAVGTCSCMVGFDGVNCKNPWLFVFIIVAPFLLLLAIITTVVYFRCVKPRRKSFYIHNDWVDADTSMKGIQHYTSSSWRVEENANYSNEVFELDRISNSSVTDDGTGNGEERAI